MNLFSNYYSENKTIQFIDKSTPAENNDLQLYKGEEDAGWVTLYFKHNKSNFEILITLAAYDLSDLVIFFENIINLEKASAIYLENEEISNPLLCRDISSKVVDYYLFIKEQFEIQELSNKKSSLELIAANIKHAYYVCKTEGLDENQIFSNLCNWLISKIHCDNTSAQIIIAFFVQNCDAYEKLS